MPSHDCIFAIRGARSSGDMSTLGMASMGRPDRKGVINGFLLADDKPNSLAIVAA
jgi:hypothetical protein